MDRFADKAIVVTGGGRGIGAAAATYLASNGARVVVNDIDLAAAEDTVARIRDAGGAAIADGADVAGWNASASLIAACVSHYGRIDGLLNNAGLFSVGRLDELQEDDFDRLFAVNVRGTANCAAHALRAMREQGRGAIVNVVSGAHMGIPAMGLYGASKGAVASLTYAWAMELAGTGVRVNAVSPMADTRMADISVSYFESKGRSVPRPGCPPEANAAVIAYLLSDDSAALSGQIVRIEGEQLGIVAHPAIMLPMLRHAGGWSIEAVADAFANQFADRLVPTGIFGAELSGYLSPSEFWKAADPG